MERLHYAAPINPYNQVDHHRNEKPEDLLSIDDISISRLDPYIPPERDTFLREGTKYGQHMRIPEYGLPYVTLTYAQSLDSQISLQPGLQTLLSGRETKAMTHYMRTKHDAILVGAGTANADNPGLNSRYSYGGRVVHFAQQPRPFILDPGKSWDPSKTEKVFELAKVCSGRAPWWIVSENNPIDQESQADQARLKKIHDVGGDIIQAGHYDGRDQGVEWEKILNDMWKTGIRSVMIEGGAAVINDLLRDKNQHLISSIIVTIAPVYLGSGGVVVAPPRSNERKSSIQLPRKTVSWIPLGHDIVMACRPRQDKISPAGNNPDPK